MIAAAPGFPARIRRRPHGGPAEPRRYEKTPLHKIVSESLEGWLEWRERAVCMMCRTGFVVAFSCRGRGVCPPCNGRHMVQTSAHLADHVIPPMPVRQWVISMQKWLRGMLADRPRAVATLTKIYLTEIERLLLATSGKG